jgi:hypothetical protein
MKKWIILFFIFFILNVSLSAIDYTDDGNISADIGISLLYPVNENWSMAGNIFGSVLFSSLHAGVGYHVPILRNIFMPGIYGEINLWLLPLIIQYLLNPDSEIEDYDLNILDFGIRVYSIFRISVFGFQPFIGFNIGILHGFSTMYGFLLAHRNFGIEYTLLQPLPDNIYTGTKPIHRVAIVYHFRD